MADFLMIMSSFGTEVGIFLACALGLPVPEEITLLSAGILVSIKQLQLTSAIISGLAGILMSDTLLYFLGRHFGPRIFRLSFLRSSLTESRVKYAESLIRRNGFLVCFIGRFLPGLRVILFTTTGVFGIKPQVFLVVDALTAVISVSFWIFIGNWMGSNFVDVTQHAPEIKGALFSIVLATFVIKVIRYMKPLLR